MSCAKALEASLDSGVKYRGILRQVLQDFAGNKAYAV